MNTKQLISYSNDSASQTVTIIVFFSSTCFSTFATSKSLSSLDLADATTLSFSTISPHLNPGSSTDSIIISIAQKASHFSNLKVIVESFFEKNHFTPFNSRELGKSIKSSILDRLIDSLFLFQNSVKSLSAIYGSNEIYFPIIRFTISLILSLSIT